MAVYEAPAGAREKRAWPAWVALGLVVAVILGAFIADKIGEQRAADRQTDVFYCTLSGVGPYDRAPNTGKLCIDL